MDDKPEVTEKLFPPPPESTNVRPFPLAPSIRELLAAHMTATTTLIDKKLEENRQALLAMPPPDITPKSATQHVVTGTTRFAQYLSIAAGALTLGAMVAKAFGRPELADLLQKFIDLIPKG